MPVDVGTQISDFTVPMADGQEVKSFNLSEQLGKDSLVFAFFPLAFTGVCTTEMCTFRDQLSGFGDLKSRVFGVSVDSPFTLNHFHQKESLNFPLLSDFNRTLVATFGVKREQPLGPGLLGVANRSVFVVDKTGTVAYAWYTENPGDLPPFDAIKDALGKLG
jgi:peroxiredoxin